MKDKLLILFYLSFVSIGFSQKNSKAFNIGEITEVDSKYLSEKRIINVYLPEGYSKTDTVSYPVIYLLDGSAHEDFLHIVGLVQFFNMTFNMPKTIVVGIANVDRKRDFTFPTKLEDLKEKYPTTGGSEAFINFIENELQTHVQNNYKTRSTKYIIGQSLGGLLATEILLKRPQLFTNYIIVSPSLWWDNQSLLKQAGDLVTTPNDKPTQIYISVGTEGKIMENDAKEISQILKKAGKKNYMVDFVPLPKENHATILHQSVYRAFEILFPYKN